MNNDYFQKNKNLIYVAFIIITLLTIFPLFSTGLGCGDDLNNYISARKGEYFAISPYMAKVAGRFYFLISYPVYFLPYAIDNDTITKIFQVVPIICSFLIFAVILSYVTKSKEFSLLFLLFSLTFSQISSHTSLFVTYPFFFSFSFSLLLLSYLLLLHYLEKKDKKLLWFSLLLFLVALLFYEVYILYVVFAGLAIFNSLWKTDKTRIQRVKSSLMLFLPYFGIACVYLTVYVLYRVYNPSFYEGTTLVHQGFKWNAFFSVLRNLSYTSVPTTVFGINRDLFTEKSELIQGFSPVVFDVIRNARAEWIVKGILVSLTGFLLMMSIGKLSKKFTLKGIGIAILLIFLPHLPLAITVKYIFYASIGMRGYVTTYFSIFGVMFLVTLLVNFLINLFNFRIRLKKTLGIVLIVLLFSISVLTDFSNYTIARDFHSANVPLLAVNELIKSDEFKKIPPKSKFYANDLFFNASFSARNVTEQSLDWGYYIYEKGHYEGDFIRREKDFREAAKDTAHELYFVAMREAVKTDDLSIALGKIDRPAPADSGIGSKVNHALVLYYSTYKTFAISFHCSKASSQERIPVKINTVNDTIPAGETVTYTINNVRKFQRATIFTLDGAAIDLRSITISNMVNPESKVIYL